MVVAASSFRQESVGSVALALAHARRLLAERPDAAARQAREILKAAPGHPEARLILGSALRRSGRAEEAVAELKALSRAAPGWPAAWLELAEALGALGEVRGATQALERAVALDRDLADVWRRLGDLRTAAGDPAGADAAYAEFLRASTRDPELLACAAHLCEGRLPEAERGLKERLKRQPTDVAAIRMLAELATRLGRNTDAENLLVRCLELAPSFAAARHNLAVVLYRQGRAEAALAELDRLAPADPTGAAFQTLRAAVLALLGEYGRSVETYERLLAQTPDQPKLWLSYGHALKTLGRQADSVAAYRRALALAPGLGEAYWSLANLKTVRLDEADVAAMADQLARPGASDDDRLHLHYALGKALEDAGDHARSFGHYSAGARIRKAQVGYDAEATSRQVARAKAVFTRELFAERAGQGCDAPDPIFVIGLPRSGSTLIEQILSSHSAVEGTMELPELAAISREAGEGGRGYPEGLFEATPEALLRWGEAYLERTRVQRKTAKPFFVDKMPNNFVHLGLIQLILPRARIIDARRHPMAACFSSFKQHFARGQHFSYDLEDLGRYWRDYAGLMDHFDEVLPGRVHRVFYERLVDDTEGQVRSLLAYCGLPFEDACLRFYETDRAVRTASSEQVRQPIYREGLDQWRRFEPWLGPLKAALGPELDRYPAAGPA